MQMDYGKYQFPAMQITLLSIGINDFLLLLKVFMMVQSVQHKYLLQIFFTIEPVMKQLMFLGPDFFTMI